MENNERMKLAAIYNVWGDWDLLELSIKNIRPLVDGVFIVFTRKSNHGEESKEPLDWDSRFNDPLMKMIHVEPTEGKTAQENERAKRNCGLHYAKKYGYTHFINLDADEFYEPEAFLTVKELFKEDPNLIGSVCPLKCYFKLPTLSVSDKTMVPFIHKITPELKFQWNTNYPFAFEGVKRDIRIDPTRQMNINEGVFLAPITMHHYSWVRKDINKKIRNSTARQNIEASTILTDYCQAKPGYYCEFYKATLEECENLFNIPDIIDHAICSPVKA